MDKATNYIVTYLINNHIIKETEAPIYQYGASILFIKIGYLISFLLLGLIFDVFTETVIFLLIYSPIRIYAGGYHAPTILKCYILSLITVIINGIICVNYTLFESYFVDEIAFILSLIYIYIYCPVDNNNKRLDEFEKHKFKKYTSIILSVYIIIFIVLFLNPLILSKYRVMVEYIVFIEFLMMFLELSNG